MVYFLSHSFSLLLDLAYKLKDNLIIYFVQFLQLLFPPFEALNLKDYIWSMVNFSNMYFIQNILYSFLYLIIILIFSVIIFNKKKFEN